MVSRLKLPREEDLERGPFRDMTMALGRLFIAAGSPGVNVVQDWTRQGGIDDVGVSHDLVSRLLQGKRPTNSSSVSTWQKVHAVADALWRHRVNPKEGSELQIDQLHQFWKLVAHGKATIDELYMPDEPVPEAYYGRGGPNTAEHFARVGYRWGFQAAGSESAYLQGAVAISAIDPNPVAGRKVYAQNFQYQLQILADQKPLRKEGASIESNYAWTPSSCIHYCTMKHRKVRSFLAVEAYVQGAVSAYFCEDITNGTLDEALAYWIPHAWMAAYCATHLMGLRGQAYGASVIGYAGVVGLKDRGRSNAYGDVTLHPVLLFHDDCYPTLHGPFDLVPERYRAEMFPFHWVYGASFDRADEVRKSYKSKFPDHVHELSEADLRELHEKIIFR